MLSTLCPIYLIVASPTTLLPSSTTKTGLFLNCKYIVRHNINMFYLYTFYFMKSDWKIFNTNLFYRIDKSCWKEACTITNSWCYVQVYLFFYSGCRMKCSKTHDKIFLVFGLIVPFIKWYQNVNICAYSKNITEGVYVRGKKVLSTHKKNIIFTFDIFNSSHKIMSMC